MISLLYSSRIPLLLKYENVIVDGFSKEKNVLKQNKNEILLILAETRFSVISHTTSFSISADVRHKHC